MSWLRHFSPSDLLRLYTFKLDSSHLSVPRSHETDKMTELQNDEQPSSPSKKAINKDSDLQIERDAREAERLQRLFGSPPPVRRAAKLATKHLAYKPQLHAIESATKKEAKKKKATKAKKPKAPAKTIEKKGGKVCSTTSKKTAAKTKPTATKCDAVKSSKSAKSKAGRKQESVVLETPLAPEPTVDLFARHSREFERIFGRLEKIDQFGFFWEDAPGELVENYSDHAKPDDDGATQPSSDKPTESKNKVIDASTPLSTTISTYPSHPPFNWEMVRRRRDYGRYFLDVQASEEKRLKQIRQCLEQEGSQPPPTSIAVLHPKGVDWDTFRDDVMGMCDSALVRNPDEVGDGKTGSLLYAVNKIKGVRFFHFLFVCLG